MQDSTTLLAREYLRSLTLLCVEDTLTTRLIYEAMFEGVVKELFFANDGKEGFEQFTLQEVDIILTDYYMPHLNGIEMIKKIREVDQKIPIILVTSMQESEILIEALQLGVTNFLKKPVVTTEVLQAVCNAAKLTLAEKYLQEQHLQRIHELQKKERYTSLQEELAFAKELNILRNDFYYQMHENSSRTLIDFLYKPLDVLSGDAYGARYLGEDRHFYFIIDGMGKGLSASLSSMLLTSFINYTIDTLEGRFDLKTILQAALLYMQPILLEEEMVAGDFMVMDYTNHTLEYSKFAMPPSLLQSETDEIRKLKSNNPPWSKYTHAITCSEVDISDIVKFLFYSDGVVENSIRHKGELYENYLQRDFLASFTKEELREKIFWRIEEQEDDITLIFINRLQCNTDTAIKKSFPTSLTAVDEANEWYVSLWSSFTNDYKLAYNAGIVFTELFMNAYEHGNLGVDAITKHGLMENDTYFTALEELEKQCLKEINVCVGTLHYNNNRYIVTTIMDEGNGFDTQILTKIFRDKKNFNGRGVYISRQSSLGIYYNTTGTHVLFLHKIEGEKK